MVAGLRAGAQGSYVVGFLPEINLNYELANEWKLNANLESRQAIRQGLFDESPGVQYDYLLTDLSVAVSKGVFFSNAWTLGYLLRLRDKAPAHRFFQQYTFNRRYVGYRVGFRLAADQTFSSAEASEYRFRTRAAGEIPLRGLAVDREEYYLKASSEALQKFSDKSYDLEVRLAPALGYAVRDDNRLEVGLDYRLDGFVGGAAEQAFWITAGWYLSF